MEEIIGAGAVFEGRIVVLGEVLIMYGKIIPMAALRIHSNQQQLSKANRCTTTGFSANTRHLSTAAPYLQTFSCSL